MTSATTAKNAAYIQLAKVATVESSVAGITFDGRQHVAWALEHATREGRRAWVELRREASNEHDANAIAVIAHATGKGALHAKVGYLPAEKATALAPIIDAGGRVRVTNFAFVGGYRGRSLGMRLAVNVYAA